MIKATVREMLDAVPALNELVAAEIDAVQAFKIARVTLSINNELEVFIKVKNDLVKRLGLEESAEEAKESAEESEEAKEFSAEMEKLLAEEVELNHSRLDPEKFGDGFNLKPMTAMALLFLFEGESMSESE